MISKQFFSTKSYCKVTFQLPKEFVKACFSPVQSVHLV